MVLQSITPQLVASKQKNILASLARVETALVSPIYSEAIKSQTVQIMNAAKESITLSLLIHCLRLTPNILWCVNNVYGSSIEIGRH